MGWLLAAVGALVVLAVSAELALRTVVRERLERRVAEVSGAASAVVVTVGSRVVGLLVGFPSVLVDLTDVPVAEGRARIGVQAHLRGVHVRPARTTSDGGTFEVVVDEGQLSALLRLPAAVARVRIREEGLRLDLRAGLGVDAAVEVSEGRLVVTPRSIVAALGNVELPWSLPELPGRAVVTSVTTDTGRLTVDGELPPGRIGDT